MLFAIVSAFLLQVPAAQHPSQQLTTAPVSAQQPTLAHAIPCISTDDEQILCCSKRAPGMPVFSTSIDLSSLIGECPDAVVAAPFGAKLTPNGQYLYVALAGGFSGANCLLGKISTATNQVVGTIPVGQFPEEIAFTTTATGNVQYGFATNSTDSTVTVFNGADQIVTTIQIPAAFGTAYPFGLAVSPNQSRVYVGTLDGSGNIFVINTSTLSLMQNETLHIPDAHGRMAFYGSTLIVTATEFEPDFSGSTANLVFVNPANPAGAVTRTIASSNNFTLYPSTQDVSIHCNGLVYVNGFDLGSHTYVYSAISKNLVRTLNSTTSASHQGNAISSRGLLAVGDFFPTNPMIQLYNAASFQNLGVIDLNNVPGTHAGVNEIVFNAAGTRMYVTMYYSDEVLVFNIQ